jgi:hypothetical protein
MKKIITFLLIMVSITLFGQTTEQTNIEELEITESFTNELNQFFVKYDSIIKRSDWENVIGTMPAKMFEFMPKEDLVNQIKKSFNNEAFTTKFNNVLFKEVTSIFKYEKVKYANVNYFNSFTFNFKQTENQTDEEFKTYMNFMTETFKNQFKGLDVVNENEKITISGIKSILVIDNPDEGEIKMVEIDKGLKEFYKMIFPISVVDKIFND